LAEEAGTPKTKGKRVVKVMVRRSCGVRISWEEAETKAETGLTWNFILKNEVEQRYMDAVCLGRWKMVFG
jgi:hypothetical protein